MIKEEMSKRDRILEASIPLFVKQGFDSTSVQDIANAANMAKGTVYLYFASKDNLIEQVYQYCNRRNVDACAVGIEEQKTVLAKLFRRMQNAIYWAIAHPEENKIERMYLRSPKYSAGYRYENQLNHYQVVDQILCQGIESGELKALPTPLLGEIFFGMGAAFLSYFEANPELLEDADTWQMCRKMVYDCLQSGKKGEEETE